MASNAKRREWNEQYRLFVQDEVLKAFMESSSRAGAVSNVTHAARRNIENPSDLIS
jgi:hypothetical protein